MQPVTVIVGTMAPLPNASVDTDQIIPKQFLKRIERTGYGQFLFHDWADDYPRFVLNRPEYRSASVLVTGPNFGTGSSREHATWALQDWGFKAVIAPSFGDIFRINSYKIGLLPVELSPKTCTALIEVAAKDPEAQVTIDLQRQVVTADDIGEEFSIDPYTKHMLLNGLDDIGLTLDHEEAIAAYESQRPHWMPELREALDAAAATSEDEPWEDGLA